MSSSAASTNKIFSEKISTRLKVRSGFAKALATARRIKAHAPHCRVILTVYEMKRLGRDAGELTALADHLTAHGLALEMLAGIYDPAGPGRMLFTFFAAMAETGREAIREAMLEGLDAAARKGNHGGRPAVITDDMIRTVLRRRAAGEPVGKIRKDLIIPTGKREAACAGTCLDRPSIMSNNREGPVPSRIAVRSMITVTYLPPLRVCRQTCSSIPMTFTPSNRAGSLISTCLPSANTASFAVLHATASVPCHGRHRGTAA
ncbi:hypothetical protein GCM10010140_74270 [Streptosporangium pseudovulgare]|uniref:Resolvase/invertase-type recombinase catalytic domain-containing protein n=1 Tax=Streptosporangium pseudovulgare TaxID=35765 RepID=A0ABQ2RKW4_9ACTN|nr:hypothetical protein GCM10010140_74270 [Streptosporangium pseudovulgare]